MYLLFSSETQLIQSGPIRLKQDNLLTALPKVGNEYDVTFEIMPNTFKNDWQSVIHLTVGNDAEEYGDRNPAVFIHGDKLLQISSAVNGNKDYKYKSKAPSVNKWTKISICQIKYNAKYMFEVWIDGNKVHSVENKKASEFNDVKIYAGDPWYESLDGNIRGLTINPYPSSCGEMIKG